MVAVRWRVLVNATDLGCQALSGAVAWGRQDADGQPDSATASVTVVDESGQLADAVRLGDVLQLVAVVQSQESVRFTGLVSDLTISHAAQTLTIAGQGALARLARVLVGDTPWPAESDGDRVLRILRLVGLPDGTDLPWEGAQGTWASPVLPGLPATASWRQLAAPDVDPGSVTIAARDVDRQPVTQLLRDVADSAAGVIFERRNGQVAYHDSFHRSWDVDQATDACLWLSDAAAFEQTLGSIVNDLEVVYGPDVDEGDRPTVQVTNPGSVDTFGRFEQRLDTQLQDAADALTIARRIVGWAGVPRWNVGSLLVDSQLVSDAAQLQGLMRRGLGDTISVEGIAEPVPTGVRLLCVEGASERLDADTWQATFYLTDARQTVPGASWLDHAQANPGLAWADAPDLPWLDADLLIIGR